MPRVTPNKDHHLALNRLNSRVERETYTAIQKGLEETEQLVKTLVREAYEAGIRHGNTCPQCGRRRN